MLEKMEAIVIKTQDYGETNKIITLFSGKFGKVAAIARGAKKPKSRMAAVTQPFIFGEFFVYLHSGLSTIQQGEVIDSQRLIREDIMKTAYAAYAAELTDKLQDAQNPDPALYHELKETFKWIGSYENAIIPVMMFELKLYKAAGIAPVVKQCVNCGNKNFPFAFSVAEGGFLCSLCTHLDAYAIKLPDRAAKLLQLFTAVSLNQVGTISVKPENQKLLRRVIDAYYEHYGGFFLKSKRFLDQIDKLN